jgi:uncharacterized protein (TIGR03437 family)
MKRHLIPLAVLLAASAVQIRSQDPVPPGTAGEWRGRILATYNLHPDAGGEPRFWIEVEDETLDLRLTEPRHLKAGDVVQIRGMRFGDQLAGAVAGINPAGACNVGVDLKLAIILVEFASSPLANIVTPQDLRDVAFSATDRSVAGYWSESSYGTVRATGDVFGPFQLAQNTIPSSPAAMIPDLVRAAGAHINWSQYNQVQFLTSSVSGFGSMSMSIGGCAAVPDALQTQGFSGGVSVYMFGQHLSREKLLQLVLQSSVSNLFWGSADALDAAPLPIGPVETAGTAVFNGDLFSAVTSGLGHLAAPHKAALGWLVKDRNLTEVQSSGSYALKAYEDQSAGVKALRIRRTPQANQWLWLEYRQPRGYDQDLLLVTAQVFSGVLGHYEDPTTSAYQDRTLMVDFTPPATKFDYRDFRDAALAAGKTWADPFGPLTLRITQADSSGATVTLSYDSPCVTLGSTAVTQGSGAATGAISVTAPAGCQWAAATVADWITITSGQNGSGNGTVVYSLAPNNGRGTRTSSVYVGRVAFQVTQATSWIEAAPSAATVTPVSGVGHSQQLKFVITDPNGASDIDTINLTLQGTGNQSCALAVRPNYKFVWILADYRDWSAMQTIGADAVLQNSLCAVDVSGISVASSGNDLTFVLPVVFQSGIGSTVVARMTVRDTTSRLANFTVGQWQVPQGDCAGTLSPIAVQAGTGVSAGTIEVRLPSGCAWMALSSVSWISLTSASSGFGPASVTYGVAPNPNPGPRIGGLLIGGQTVWVSQAGAATSRPAIAENGVFNGASNLFGSNIGPGAWVTIQGVNLAPTTRTWRNSDFVGDALPTQLDGVSARINGKPAYVYYISPTQLNVLAPSDTATSAVSVVVETSQGTSDAVSVWEKDTSPALFLFDAGDRKYPAAVFADGAYVGMPSLYPSLQMRAAKPGDTILLFATGLGDTNPATTVGQMISQPAPMRTKPSVRIGGVSASVPYAGLVGPGLYQINVVVPNVPDGDQPLWLDVSSYSSPPGVYLTIRR